MVIRSVKLARCHLPIRNCQLTKRGSSLKRRKEKSRSEIREREFVSRQRDPRRGPASMIPQFAPRGSQSLPYNCVLSSAPSESRKRPSNLDYACMGRTERWQTAFARASLSFQADTISGERDSLSRRLDKARPSLAAPRSIIRRSCGRPGVSGGTCSGQRRRRSCELGKIVGKLFNDPFIFGALRPIGKLLASRGRSE